MKQLKLDNKGFSITELMFAMTILAIGLLALAQMQMMAMRGTTSAREFSTATKIAREGMERFKIPGAYIVRGQTGVDVKLDELLDRDMVNNGDEFLAPVVNSTTNIAGLKFDTREVFIDNSNADPPQPMSLTSPTCVERYNYPGDDCSGDIASDDWDFVRITNVKNWPPGSPLHDSVMKEVSIMVLWKERGLTRSVNLRTLIGRKDNDFY